jgi:hypothetical protein
MALAPVNTRRIKPPLSQGLWRVAVVASVTLSVVLAISTIDRIILEKALRDSGKYIEGTVINIDDTLGEGLGLRKIVLGESVIAVQYAVHGVDIIRHLHMRPDSSVKVGKRVTLLMDPSNPHKVDFQERLRPAWLIRATGFFLSFVLVGVCLGASQRLSRTSQSPPSA